MRSEREFEDGTEAPRSAAATRPPAPTGARALALRLGGTLVGARTEDPVVGLTFDDGPDADVTPRILDQLERHGGHATFFLLAKRAEAQPELAQELVARGHEVGLHGDDHVLLTTATPREVVRVIGRGRSRLERVLGRPVRLFRPPYGSQSPFTYAVARALRLRVVTWTATGRDWIDQPVPRVVDHAMSSLRPGGLVLLHDRFESHPLQDFTPPSFDRAEVAGAVLDAVAARGWRSATVGELVGGRTAQRRLWFRSDG